MDALSNIHLFNNNNNNNNFVPPNNANTNAIDPIFLNPILLDKSLDRIKSIVQKTGIIFIGFPGEGKSTLMNYFCGVNYRKVTLHRMKRVEPLHPEFIKTNTLSDSESYPSVIQFMNKPIVAIEFPGFPEKCPSTEELYSSLSCSMIVRQLKAIQSLILVSSWASISTISGYHDTAYHLGAMIHRDPLTAKNAFLCVTKIDSKLTKNEVREKLFGFTTDLKINEEIPINQMDVTPEYWKQYCIKIATRALLSRQESVLLIDVTQINCQKVFQSKIHGLENHLSPTQFDFTCYNASINRFKEILKRHISHYFILLKKRTQLNGILIDNQSQLVKKNEQIIEQSSVINSLQKELLPFDGSEYKKSLDGINMLVNFIQLKRSENLQKKIKFEDEIKKIQIQINAIASNPSEMKIPLVNKHNVEIAGLPPLLEEGKRKSEMHRGLNTTYRLSCMNNNNIFWIYPSPKSLLDAVYKQWIDHNVSILNTYSEELKNNIELAIKTLIENKNSYQPAHINGFLSAFENTNLSQGFLKVLMENRNNGDLYTTFIKTCYACMIGNREYEPLKMNYDLEIFTSNFQHTSEERVALKKFYQQITLLKISLRDCQEDIWNLEKQLEDQQAKIQTKKRLQDDDQLAHDSQNTLKQEKIDLLQIILSQLIQEKDLLAQQIENCYFNRFELNTILSNNKNLYDKISQIIQIMDFKDENFDSFTHLLTENN
jgi:hypothetical protein